MTCTERRTRHLNAVERRLDEIQRRDRADAERSPSWAVTGRSGRKPTTGAAIDASVDRAVEAVRLEAERDRLELQARLDATADEREAQQHRRDVALIRWWLSIQPGDTVRIQGVSVIVAKKARKSLTTQSGNRWSVSEVTGVKAKRVDALLAEVEAG